MQIWRVTLALWLIVSGIVWFIGPTFALAFPIMGILAIVAAVFLIFGNRSNT